MQPADVALSGVRICSHCGFVQSKDSAWSLQACIPSSNMHSIITHAFHHQTCIPSSNMHSIIKHAFHHQTCVSLQGQVRSSSVYEPQLWTLVHCMLQMYSRMEVKREVVFVVSFITRDCLTWCAHACLCSMWTAY